jgi:hypothetical protein
LKVKIFILTDFSMYSSMPVFNGKNLVPLKVHNATESYYFFQEVVNSWKEKAQLSSSMAT